MPVKYNQSDYDTLDKYGERVKGDVLYLSHIVVRNRLYDFDNSELDRKLVEVYYKFKQLQINGTV